MSQAVNAAKLADDFKNLYSKAIQDNIALANRLSRIASDAAREFSTSAQRKTLPSPIKGFTRMVEFNLACWSALTEHSVAFANEMAGAAERARGLLVYLALSHRLGERPLESHRRRDAGAALVRRRGRDLALRPAHAARGSRARDRARVEHAHALSVRDQLSVVRARRRARRAC